MLIDPIGLLKSLKSQDRKDFEDMVWIVADYIKEIPCSDDVYKQIVGLLEVQQEPQLQLVRCGEVREISLEEKVSQSLFGRFGEDSRRWKGKNAGYVAKHMWIIKNYGKANHCSINPDHTAKRYEWANISGNYLRDISDYIQLCPSCHRKFDSKNTCKHGHEYTPQNTYIDPRGYRNCRICRRESGRKFKNAIN